MNIINNSTSLAVLSGLLAALSGFLGKIGLDSGQSQLLAQLVDTESWPWAGLLVRSGCVLFTLILNTCMITLYTRALSLSEVSAVVASLNTATNLSATALLSHLVLAESLSAQWCAGTVLVFTGVTIILSEDVSCDNEEEHHSKTQRKSKKIK